MTMSLGGISISVVLRTMLGPDENVAQQLNSCFLSVIPSHFQALAAIRRVSGFD